jgi:DNA repair protein RadC
MKIKELGMDDRPREKMAEKGLGALSNAELIATMVRTGSRKDNAVDISRMLLRSAGDSLVTLSGMSVKQMCRTAGIGPGKAASVVAAFELGRRCAVESSTIDKVSITDPAMIYRHMLHLMKGLAHEECWVIYLNRANYILGKERLSSGGTSSTVIDVKMIIKNALEMLASGIILVHNHPSGNPQPGACDIKQTGILKKAAETFDISLLDHIIIADDRFYSFAEERVEVMH